MKRCAQFLGVWLLVVVLSAGLLVPAQAAGPAQTTAAATPTATAQALEGLVTPDPNAAPADGAMVVEGTPTTAGETPAEAIPQVQATSTPTTTMVIEDIAAPPPLVPNPSFVNAIQGMVINWAYRNEPNFLVRLNGGGWQLEANTDSNALYSFIGLGEGIALVNPVLPRGSDTHPLTVDLAVPIAGSPDRMVNLGLYGGDQLPTGLPMSIGIQSSAAQVTPGDKVQFVVSVKNNMPHTVHGVMVTDLFPAGIVPLGIAASSGSPWLGGQFAAAAIGELQQNQTAAVTVTAQLAPDISPDRAIVNRASVIYNESVALQDSVTINSPEVPNQLPETGGVGLPLGALVLMLAIIGFRQVRLHAQS